MSFLKVAEYQRRGVVHFHALIRLDAPGADFAPPHVSLDAADLAWAIGAAAGRVRLTVDLPDISAAQTPPLGKRTLQTTPSAQGVHNAPRHPTAVPDRELVPGPNHQAHATGDLNDQTDPGTPLPPPSPRTQHVRPAHQASIAPPAGLVLRFGTKTGTQAVNGGPAGELTPERFAAYIATYATGTRAGCSGVGVGARCRRASTGRSGSVPGSALSEAEVASPPARRPYDLRHAAASLWLNGGVPATEVARRLGHSVAVLLKVYANCVDGQEATANARIQAALAGAERGTLAPGVAPGDGAAPDPAGQSRDTVPPARRPATNPQVGGLA